MKVFVTRSIAGPGLEKLRAAGLEVVVSEKEGALTHEELLAHLRKENPDAVLCLLTDKIDAEAMAAAPNARIFANYAVGFDNIDLLEAKSRGLAVTNTPDVLTEAVAEHAVALILSLGRRVAEADRFTREGKYAGWDPLLFLGMEIKDKVLGIVGGGRIGTRVAEIMQRGFGMRIVYHDQARSERLDQEVKAEFIGELDDLLAISDVVSVHLPLNDSTRHLFGAERLTRMKRSSYLINTARGAIVDETALAAALEDRLIAGAALDVFENEPHISPGLAALENLIMTPHIASATLEARERMGTVAAENIIAVLSGQPALNPVPVVN